MDKPHISSVEADMLADANMFPVLLGALKLTVAELAKYETRKAFKGAEGLKEGRKAIASADALNAR